MRHILTDTVMSFCLGAFFTAAPVAQAFPLRSPTADPEPDWCLRCHGNTRPTPGTGQRPPRLPRAFSLEWDMHEIAAPGRPPFAHAAGIATGTIHGTTHYDWGRRRMTEIYRERCIDIFPGGRDFPCQFTSVGRKTYFITFDKERPGEPASCCLWRKSDFWAPRPDVLMTMATDETAPDPNVTGTAWWLWDIPLPGPFGYGTKTGSAEPRAFWFPVIGGWVQQEFHHVTLGTPDARHFALPAQCTARDVPVCAP